MKSNLNIKIKFTGLLVSVFFMLIGLNSCDDESLNVTPSDRLLDEAVWAETGTADLFLNGVYNLLPDGNNWYDSWDSWADNSICGFSSGLSRVYGQQANYTPSTLTFAFWNGLTGHLDWTSNYRAIRRANLFISKVNASGLSDDYKAKRILEARFLRAYFYHILWMGYGGVPVITEPDDVMDGEAILHARSTWNETLQFITSELGDIAGNLPVTNESGRATKGAALTLKGWCELYAASEHFNPDNDKSKWAIAAETNRQVIDMGIYNLYSDYQTLFLPEGNINKEGIFIRQYIMSNPNLGGRFDSYTGATFTKGGAETSFGGINPTQELVDDYAMANGLPISDPASGYDPQRPYLNREKRFYQSIIIDGSWWYNDTIFTRQGISSKNEIDLSDKNDATNTGYYIRKRCNDKITLGPANWNGYTSSQNYYYFRFGEVLLNYAEAQNEAVGPDMSVYDAINQIRNRSALPNLAAGMSQDEMRNAIRRERRVELAFEDRRYWDLIRWDIAHINLNRPVHGISIKAGTNGKLVYTPVTVPGGNRKFDVAKNYLFPIPQGAIDRNKNLTQNPGY